jgi:hypothetical protein
MGRDGKKYADNGEFNPSGSNQRWSLAQNQRLPERDHAPAGLRPDAV